MSAQYETPWFKVEKSQSRTGKHIVTSSLFVFKRDAGILPYKQFLVSEEKANPTYIKGEAKLVRLRISRGDFILYTRFLRNFKGVIKGEISVFNYHGELVYRAKYNAGYVAKSVGDPVYAWLVRLLLSYLKIPVTSTRLGDEK